MKPEVAQRRIQAFRDRFGEAHFALATHAAFPLALTPDLLYRLWANFQQDIQGEVLNIPWIAVADLLLSSLCEEVGNELYEMPSEARNTFLEELKRNPRFGETRIRELSSFVLNYVKEQLSTFDIDKRDFAQAQYWTALAYIEPNKTAQEIALILSELNLEERLEWLRLGSIIETSSESLVQFEPLLIYTRGMTKWIQGERAKAIEQIQKLEVKNGCLEFLGISLSIPSELSQNTYEKPSRKHTQKRKKILQNQVWQCSHTLEHSGSVLSVAISPNEQIIASAGEDRVIKLWSAPTGKELSRFAGHQDTIYSIAISRDGQILASGSGDRTINIWNLNTGELLKTLTGHSDAVYSLSISSNNQILVSGSRDETIRIWNIESGECLSSLKGHSSWVRSVVFSPDSKFLASGGDDEKIIIWDITQAEPVNTLSGHSNWVRSLAMSADGQTLVSGGNDFKIQIWKFPSGEITRTVIEFVSDQIYSVAISSDNQFIVGAGRNRRISIWSLATWELPNHLDDHVDEINSLAISSDCKTIISGSRDKTVKIWNMTS